MNPGVQCGVVGVVGVVGVMGACKCGHAHGYGDAGGRTAHLGAPQTHRGPADPSPATIETSPYFMGRGGCLSAASAAPKALNTNTHTHTEEGDGKEKSEKEVWQCVCVCVCVCDAELNTAQCRCFTANKCTADDKFYRTQ